MGALPQGHTSHLVAPDEDEIVPRGHRLQMPVSVAKDPGLH